jgi:hypothetical protein
MIALLFGGPFDGHFFHLQGDDRTELFIPVTQVPVGATRYEAALYRIGETGRLDGLGRTVANFHFIAYRDVEEET